MKKSHRKKDISVDAKLIIALNRKQPQTRNELIASGINRSSFYRILPLLINREIIKETTKGYAFADYIEQPNYWTTVKNKFAEVGGHEVKITIQKASDDGVDPITGWFKFKHDTEYSAKAIIVMKNAPELVKIAKEFKIHFRDEFEDKEFIGVILTQDSISYMDQFTWQNELYKIWNTEDIMDGYNFSFRIGYLDWLPK